MDSITAWLHEKNPGLTGTVAPDEDLIEARLIDSMDFLEFIDLLEELSGNSIDLQEVTIDDFRTLDRIQRTFLAPPVPSAASGAAAGAASG
ncbi:acyl carrier protein [Streptomyces sp. NPDC048462]|uniref:acyl carrier protein n=1 Tax=Streptomyces sp. NPDC048462 TaxID=3365555 RepID=UPI0037171725